MLLFEYDGVKLIVALFAWFVLFKPKKEVIAPVPLEGRPIELLLLFQLNIVPGTGPLGAIAAVKSPKHNDWLVIGSIIGIGFTVMSNAMSPPTHVTPLFV